ncbi:hypothetical protein E1181_29855 [Saccharopolyspora terrae]|uniref:Uncharacterized protein n=1 Tax=Saccharopolyspora terrae TaxID=2530384 RepID=A0A4R4VHI2_9PSEU|nr:hypothetical protein [Saccharopolyspora terrae]TDC99229.1 hypothetical protein E1181_29855 [Saccharopolyspora terrae]
MAVLRGSFGVGSCVTETAATYCQPSSTFARCAEWWIRMPRSSIRTVSDRSRLLMSLTSPITTATGARTRK